MTDSPKREVADKSPFAGCTIFITAFVVMLFLIVFSVTVLFRQGNEIIQFTDDQPIEIAVDSLEGRELELKQMAEKLKQFRSDLDLQKTAELELSAAEINLAIAAYEPLKDFRKTLRVHSISQGEIHFEISFPLNGKPRFAKEGERGWIHSDPRYLNGTMVSELGLLDGELVLRIKEIQVPNKKVAQGFIDQMSPYRIAERYLEEEVLGGAMKKLTAVELKDNKLSLKKISGDLPQNTITDKQVNAAAERLFTFFAFAASLFLLFVAIVVIIAFRVKKKKTDPLV